MSFSTMHESSIIRGLVLKKTKVFDKVRMCEEIMTNDDNLESNALTSSLLKKMSGLHAGTS